METIGKLFCLLMVASLCGCQTEVKKNVMIRVVNRSAVDLRDVVIKFPDQTEQYGDIAPGKATDYRKVNKAYGYAHIKAVMDGKEAVLQPTDYKGEHLLAGGVLIELLDQSLSLVDLRGGPAEHDGPTARRGKDGQLVELRRRRRFPVRARFAQSGALLYR